MRIVYVVPLLAPYAVTRFEELSKIEGVELHVIVEKDTYKERSGWKYQQIKGVHTYLLEGSTHSYVVNHRDSGYTIDNAYLFSKGLRPLVKKINPDICIVCNSTQLLALLGPRKYIIGVVVEDTLRAEEGRKTINRIIKRKLLKTADVFFPFSNDAILFLKKNGITKNCYRSSWSIGEKFFSKDKEQKEKIRTELKMKESKKIYTIVSSLIPRKGVGQFIDAWMDMPEHFLKYNELHILGDGPLRDELMRTVKESNLNNNIYFRGNIPYSEVATYLLCSDVFVLPTLEDLCSLSVFEAAASGLPILTTIYNGAKDLVVEGKNGYIFDSENKNSIQDALVKMDSSDLDSMSKASYDIALNYTDKIVMHKFYNILEGILSDED